MNFSFTLQSVVSGSSLGSISGNFYRSSWIYFRSMGLIMGCDLVGMIRYDGAVIFNLGFYIDVCGYDILSVAAVTTDFSS